MTEEPIPTPEDLILFMGDQLDVEGRLLIGDVALRPLLDRAGVRTPEREKLVEVIDGLRDRGVIAHTGGMGEHRHELTEIGIRAYRGLCQDRERERQKRHPVRGLQIRLDDWLEQESTRTPHATPLLQRIIGWLLAFGAGLITGLMIS